MKRRLKIKYWLVCVRSSGHDQSDREGSVLDERERGSRQQCVPGAQQDGDLSALQD